MDKSLEYIGMCEKADEIQKHWKREIGDFYHTQSRGNKYTCVIKAADDTQSQARYYPTQYTWLPRQEQLQNIYVDSYAINCIVYQFNEWWEKKGNYNLFLKSMEQLWLAFVMKKIYNKTWDGEKWM